MTFDTALEFDQIREMLGELACTNGARERFAVLAPAATAREALSRLNETTQARRMLDAVGSPPLTSMEALDKILALLKAGGVLSPEHCLGIVQFLTSCRRMRSYLSRGEYLQTELTGYGRALAELPELEGEILRCIRGDMVDSSASPELKEVRRKMEQWNGQIKARLNGLLQNNRAWFSDAFVATRGGRLALPVKREHRAQVPGTVVDISASGGTVFIEPASVTKLQEELNELKIREENEVRRILFGLTALAEGALPALEMNRGLMEALDFAFAKGSLSLKMDAIPPLLTEERRIVIKEGRHPLMDREKCVPLTFALGGETRGVVITGPNTGGKTVALKTVGLLSLMAQSGLHVPAGEGTALCLHRAVLCDIGDGQSIAQNLSTFSAHMTGILTILKGSSSDSMVLLDELGSGTDPMEGMGIAIAILEALKEKGCLFIATTHYPEVKEYAYRTPGLLNARMAFDRDTLSPLYRLELGEAGESCALYIIERLGFSREMIEKAREAAYAGRDRAPSQIPAMGITALPPPEKIALPDPKKPVSAHAASFRLGDGVLVYPGRELGLVYAPADEKGLVGVQIKGVKHLIPHKRLKLHVTAENMYPEDYDFSIVFDSVENRKARHRMEKGHRPGLMIQYEKEPGHAND